eukprot:jgi/Picsp_1/1800/NSC_05268-R2_protein
MQKGHTFPLPGEAENMEYVGFLHSMLPFYEFIGSLNYFKDSKTIVDMPLRKPVGEFLQAFNDLKSEISEDPTAVTEEEREHLLSFIAKWFHPVGSDTESAPCRQLEMEGDDFHMKNDVTFDTFKEYLLNCWPKFCRQSSDIGRKDPPVSSLVPAPNPFIIPGERFRESYYWDSFWIILGLLEIDADHVDIAKGVLRNFSHMIRLFGMIPNGFRSYYLNRSQPPMFGNMVRALHDKLKSDGVLLEFLPAALTELEFWRSSWRSIQVVADDGSIYTMSRYYSSWHKPRPESLKEDVSSWKEFLDSRDGSDDPLNIPSVEMEFYRHIAAAAESGWDFSTRWLTSSNKLSSIRTTNMLPADLNALVMLAEMNAGHMAQLLGWHDDAEKCFQEARQRQNAIQNVLWDPSHNRWRDVVVQPTNDGVYRVAGYARDEQYASDWVPLWCGCAAPDSVQALAAIASLKASHIYTSGGIAASSIRSGQQWDWPNVWPPLQYFLAEGCGTFGGSEGRAMRRSIISSFLESAFEAWRNKGTLPEKLDCERKGGTGCGGEYDCVEGFGWTNGLALYWTIDVQNTSEGYNHSIP